MSDQFQKDKEAYRAASAAYRAECEKAERDDDYRKANFLARQACFAAKKDAAENMLMNVRARFDRALKCIGLLEMYDELTAGNGPTSLLFKIADETLKLADNPS